MYAPALPLALYCGRQPDGLGFHVSGPAGYASDSIEAFSGGGGLTTITALVVVVILLLTYRSPWLPLLSLVTVGGALVMTAFLDRGASPPTH
ncbi:MMPL family protein [Streptomyces sp. SLBN-118]|uniref:MMPL family transporter n=1 Tax=Streptomyces sp. SLBN-118 TaxID=2768454 RepID=UPI00116700B0|nr:MMPL family transporter [Streptomyces sp. SLBN-118]TQK50455.1 MMPL family protein [Streptomyces sp. SLBN-118]